MVDFDKYMIPVEEGFGIGRGIICGIVTALLIRSAIKKGKLAKDKKDLKYMITNLSPEQKESISVMRNKYNPIFKKIAEELKKDCTKKLGPNVIKAVSFKSPEYPEKPEIISHKNSAWIATDLMVYHYDFGIIEDEKLWETVIDPFNYSEQQELINSYNKKYEKYSDIFKLELADMDHYGSVLISLTCVDDLGFIKPGIE